MAAIGVMLDTWIQTVWHYAVIPEIHFWKKKFFEKKSTDDSKIMRNYPACTYLITVIDMETEIHIQCHLVPPRVAITILTLGLTGGMYPD